MTYRQVQDWEYAEEVAPDDWQTVDIQIETESEALERGQEHANRTGRRVAVSTSVRFEDAITNSVEDRGPAVGDPQPVVLTPAVARA